MLPVMTSPRRLIAAGAALSVLTLPLAAMSAQAKNQTVEGKLTWSVSTTYSDPGDPTFPNYETREETTQEEHTLQIKAVRDPGFTRTYVFKRLQAPYTYTFSSTRVTREYSFSQLDCETTTTANLSGSGQTDAATKIFGKYNGLKNVLVIDKRTKGISVEAGLPATGTMTTISNGFGLSPCSSGSYTDPVEERGSTSLNDSRNFCLPQGLKNPGSSVRPLYGKFDAKKKRFNFACTKTFDDGRGTVQTLNISGSLKYKK